jgi:hypothetical protein
MVSQLVYLHEVFGTEEALEPALVVPERASGGLSEHGMTCDYTTFAL